MVVNNDNSNSTGIHHRPPRPRAAREIRLADVEAPVSDHNQRRTSRILLHERKLTVPTAARMLGVGEGKLREYIRKGMIPVLDLDGRHLLLESDLEAFLNGRYGPISKARDPNPGLPPLPRFVVESELLTKVPEGQG